MNMDRVARRDTKAAEGTPPVFAQILAMKFIFTSEKFAELTGLRSEAKTLASREISEDAFLGHAHRILEGSSPLEHTYDSMKAILKRESMKKSPKLALFKKALPEIMKKFPYIKT